MNVYLWGLFIVGGLFLLYLGFKFKSDYPIETHIMLIVAGFLILMSGLFVFVYGVDFPIGEHTRNYPACSLCGGNWTAVYENVTDPLTNRSTLQFKGYEPSIGILNGSNSSFYATTYIASSDKTLIYSTLKGGLRGSFGVSWALIFLAFAIFLSTSLSWIKEKKNSRNRSYSEDEE